MTTRVEVIAGRRGNFRVTAIGVIESSLLTPERAPRQGSEGAPDAWLVLDATYARGLTGITIGDELIVVTWLHRACRTVLEVHPRDDPTNAIAGVFATRSPHRPNPLGLHRVTVIDVLAHACASARSRRSTARRWSTSRQRSATWSCRPVGGSL